MPITEPDNLAAFFQSLREIERSRTDALIEMAEEFLKAVTADIRKSVSEKTAQPTPTNHDGLVDRKGLAAMLNISERTISDLQNEGLPCYRFNKAVRYRYEEVLTWSKGRKIRRRNSKPSVLA